MIDLSWTGNFFLNDDSVRSILVKQASFVRFTSKGTSDSFELRQALASYYHVPIEWIFAGVGSSQILDSIVRHLGQVLVIDVVPNFKMARLSSERNCLPYLQLPLRDFDELPAALRAINVPAGSLLILSAPRNPFADTLRQEVFREVVSHFPGTVVVDEAYAEFGDSNFIPLLESFRNLIVVRTFSKAWGLANLRVGYAIAPSLSRDFHDRFLLPYNIGELSEKTASTILFEDRAVRASVAMVSSLRAQFVRSLAQIPGTTVLPSCANFVCLEHPMAVRFQSMLGECGIKVALLSELPYFPADWPNGLRITVPNAEVQQTILTALRDSI